MDIPSCPTSVPIRLQSDARIGARIDARTRSQGLEEPFNNALITQDGTGPDDTGDTHGRNGTAQTFVPIGPISPWVDPGLFSVGCDRSFVG